MGPYVNIAWDCENQVSMHEAPIGPVIRRHRLQNQLCAMFRVSKSKECLVFLETKDVALASHKGSIVFFLWAANIVKLTAHKG